MDKEINKIWTRKLLDMDREIRKDSEKLLKGFGQRTGCKIGKQSQCKTKKKLMKGQESKIQKKTVNKKQ